MIKFSIFKKSSKIYWSVNKIYYGALFTILGLGFMMQHLFKPAEYFFQWLAITVMLIGLLYKIKGFTQIEPLRGYLDGYLFFEKESITIDGKLYSLDEIREIKISNDDYSGKLIHVSKGNIGPALSNGTNNTVHLLLKTKDIIQIQFELINSDDFQQIKSLLIEYYTKGKIDFNEMTDVLGARSTTEIRELKEQINKQNTFLFS
jgi:hypothetical protein